VPIGVHGVVRRSGVKLNADLSLITTRRNSIDAAVDRAWEFISRAWQFFRAANALCSEGSDAAGHKAG